MKDGRPLSPSLSYLKNDYLVVSPQNCSNTSSGKKVIKRKKLGDSKREKVHQPMAVNKAKLFSKNRPKILNLSR